MFTECTTAKVILLVENDFILINRITQNIDKEYECFFSSNNIILFWSGENIVFNTRFFFLLYGQKSEQANREHINPAGKHSRFSRVTCFFISSLVKIWKVPVFLVYGKAPITI